VSETSDEYKSSYIGFIQGVWTGHIIRKDINNGYKFAFLNQQYFCVQKNSLIDKTMCDLIDKGEIHEACEIVRQLNEFISGYENDDVKMYL
jgi:hypothetical protein